MFGTNVTPDWVAETVPVSVESGQVTRDVEIRATRGGLLKVTVLSDSREAQNAPSYYGVFGLLWNGRLLSDHYVSRGRFKNLLKREILKERA